MSNLNTAIDLDYTYRYAGQSALLRDNNRNHLSLVTSPECGSSAQFFHGRVNQPKRTADLLIAIVSVVQSRFHVPAAMLGRILILADPVITCSQSFVRFEGFSSCGGAYARLDLLPDALDGDRLTSGTTNVDINAPMRSALSKLRVGETMDLAVGAEGLAIQHNGQELVERKVTLPSRWLRGFVEVQSFQANMELSFEVPGAEFRRFLNALPRGFKGAAWVSLANRSIRLSTVASTGAACVGGIARLRVLEPIARYADKVRVYAPRDTCSGESSNAGATAWEITTSDSRFHLVLSPDVWRGFSGEGQVLETLAKNNVEKAATVVRASLRWQEVIDASDIASQYGLKSVDVVGALAELAASGLIGYDLSEQAYFHRELPFDLSHITKLQPRLKSANRLLDDAAVSLDRGSNPMTAWVKSGDVEYRVTLEADAPRCTCVWFAKHKGLRGPCKHILAAQLALQENKDASDRT
jgi:hypothetical protein